MPTSNSATDNQSPLRKELLEFYEELVASLTKSHAKGEIKNDSMDHAEILFKYMIQSAKREILIFTGKLNPAFYLRYDVKSAFEAFFKNSPDGEVYSRSCKTPRTRMNTGFSG